MINFLEKIDILGNNQFVLFNMKNRNNSIIGGLLSIFLYIIFILFSIFITKDYFNNAIEFSLMKKYKYNISPLDYEISYSFYNEINNEKISDIVYDMHIVNNDKNEKIISKNIHESLNNINTIKIKLGRTGKHSNLKLSFSFNTNENLICRFTFPILFYNDESENFEIYNSEKDINFKLGNMIYFKKIIVKEDNGILFNNISKYEYIQFDKIFYNDNQNSGEVNFILSDEILVFKKEKKKLINIFFYLYSFYGILVCIFNHLNFFETSKFYHNYIKHETHKFIKNQIYAKEQNIFKFSEFNKRKDEAVNTIIRINKASSNMSHNLTDKNVLIKANNEIIIAPVTCDMPKIKDIKVFSFIDNFIICFGLKSKSYSLKKYLNIKDNFKMLISIDYIIYRLSKLETELKSVDDKILNRSFVINDSNSIK